MPPRSPRSWSVLAAAWAAVLFVALLWPAAPGTPSSPGADKVVHFACFAVLGLLAVLGAPSAVVRHGSPFWWTMVAAAVLGVGSEVLQGVLDAAAGWGRSAEVGDGVADLVGAALGAGWATRRANPAAKESSAAP